MADREPHRDHAPQRIRAAPPPPSDDWALFLDVDGCLLEIADVPDGVVVPPDLPGLLAALRTRLHGALALVSGRNVATLDGFFAPHVFDAAGLHGAEHRHAGTLTVPGEPSAALRDVLALARGREAEFPGVLVEDKGAALALHWRQRPEAEAMLLDLAEAALPTLDGYRLQHGKGVVEIRPAATSKGTAIDAFLQSSAYAGRLPVFAGDDLTDESGFRAVNAAGGISVLVGERDDSAATHGLPDPASVRAWLAQPPVRKPADDIPAAASPANGAHP